MDTCILSGPTEANEAATDTFTLVGKTFIASVALPEKTMRFFLLQLFLVNRCAFQSIRSFFIEKRAVAFPIKEVVLNTSNPPVAPDTK